MKKALVLAAALGLLGASSTAQAASLWQGTVTIMSFGGIGCDQRYTLGMAGTSEFRPQLSALDGPTGLTMMFGRSAFAFTWISGNVHMRGTGLAQETWIGDEGPHLVIQGVQQVANYMNWTITPATITANTGTITIVGFIGQFKNAACVQAFKAVYTNSPIKSVVIPPH